MGIELPDQQAAEAERPSAAPSRPQPERRWPEGWYLLPALILGIAIWGLALYSIAHLLHFAS